MILLDHSPPRKAMLFGHFRKQRSANWTGMAAVESSQPFLTEQYDPECSLLLLKQKHMSVKQKTYSTFKQNPKLLSFPCDSVPPI